MLFLCQLLHCLFFLGGGGVNGVSLLNNLADWRSTVTYVLNLYDVEIYERTCIIWDKTGDFTQMRTKYASAFESILN